MKGKAARAKERQATSTGGASPQLMTLIPQADTGKARDKAAAASGLVQRYLRPHSARKHLQGRHHSFAVLKACNLARPMEDASRIV